MEELSHRERVLLSLSHQETDRVPVDFMATPEAWERLKRHLGISDNEEVLRQMGVDLRHPRQPYVGPRIRFENDGSWTDPWGVRRKRVPHRGGAYEETVEHPLAPVSNANQLADHCWPKPEWWDADALARQIRTLDQDVPCAIALEEFGDPGGIFEIACYLRGMEQFLVDLIERPGLAYEIMSRVADFYSKMLERVMAVARERIDLIWTSDDLAHQHGQLISVSLWKELIAPHHERLNQRIHESGARVMYHSCGAVKPFIPHLVSIGVDVLDVLQFSAADMDPVELKSNFGDQLCFHGGMDVQSVLPFGTPAEVKGAARHLIEVLAANGGYILAPTHNVQVDTPAPNIVSMYAEAGSLQGSRRDA